MQTLLPTVVLVSLLLAGATGTLPAACPVSLDVNGSTDASDPVQTGQLVWNGVIGECSGKTPPPVNTVGPHHYDAYTLTNTTGAAACLEITTTFSVDHPVFTAAYLDAFVPGSVAANYLSDQGLSVVGQTVSSFGASVPAGGRVVVVVSELYARGGSYRLQVQCAEAVPRGSVIIDEYRLRGPAGALDEYVSLYNATEAAITTMPGWTLFAGKTAGAGRIVASLPPGLTIPPHGHLLVANALGYSLSGYPSGAGAATPDVTFTDDIPDGYGLLLCRRPDTSDAYVLDAVGYADDDALFREQAGLPAGGAERDDNMQYAFLRRVVDGVPRDTNANEDDFIGVAAYGAATALGRRLGAPGPRNLASPIAAAGSWLNTTDAMDPYRPFDAFPNVERLTTPVSNGAQGTWEIRRAVTNTTGRPITRLRFRVSDLSTYPPPSGYAADLRALSSTTGNVTRSDGSVVSVLGTTLEEPPVQAMGGGVNSTLSVPSVTQAHPLAPGATIFVRFRFGVQQQWQFNPPTLELTAESLPVPLATQPNRPPAVYAAPRFVVRAGGALQPNVLIVDPDSGNADIRLTMGASHGTLSILGPVPASDLLAGTGHGDAIFTAKTSQEKLDDLLSRVYYRPFAAFTGRDDITITVNDLGASGSGGARETSVAIPVQVSSGGSALAIAGGLANATASDMFLMDLPSDGPLDIVDAVRQARPTAPALKGVVTAPGGTPSGDSLVYLDDPAINGRPDACVMAVHQFVAQPMNSPLGVLYDPAVQRWLVFTERFVPIPDGERILYTYDGPQKRVFRPDAGNTYTNATLLDDPSVNGQPDAIVLAQHEMANSSFAFPLCAYYTIGHWYAMTEGSESQLKGDGFIFCNAGSAGGRVTRDQHNAYSTYGVYLDDKRLNDRPNAVVFAQHMYQNALVKSPMGVRYDSDRHKWAAYNEDATVPFPDGESVNYWVPK